MNFSVAHVIPNISLSAYEALYFDEAFSDALCHALKLSRHLVSRQIQGQKLSRAVQVIPERNIPAPVAKVLGGERIAYTEHIEYTLGSFAGRWHTVSSLLSDKVHSRGTFQFTAEGPDVRRVVDGTVTVKIFALGSLVERYIVADVEKSYAQAALFTQDYLKTHSPQS